MRELKVICRFLTAEGVSTLNLALFKGQLCVYKFYLHIYLLFNIFNIYYKYLFSPMSKGKIQRLVQNIPLTFFPQDNSGWKLGNRAGPLRNKYRQVFLLYFLFWIYMQYLRFVFWENFQYWHKHLNLCMTSHQEPLVNTWIIIKNKSFWKTKPGYKYFWYYRFSFIMASDGTANDLLSHYE